MCRALFKCLCAPSPSSVGPLLQATVAACCAAGLLVCILASEGRVERRGVLVVYFGIWGGVWPGWDLELVLPVARTVWYHLHSLLVMNRLEADIGPAILNRMHVMGLSAVIREPGPFIGMHG